MDSKAHGKLLSAAIAGKGLSRQEVADAVDRSLRTITGWCRGEHMPKEREVALLRKILGPYDLAGDPVEVAIRSSGLIEWRQDAVLSDYKRHMHEQQASESA